MLSQVTSNGTLIIHDAQREDSGSYRCTASNYLGRIHAVALLKINGKKLMMIQCSTLYSTRYKFPPRIVSHF